MKRCKTCCARCEKQMRYCKRCWAKVKAEERDREDARECARAAKLYHKTADCAEWFKNIGGL